MAPHPDVVGTAEIADMLGVSRQRVRQLAQRPDFPPTIARLSAGDIWLRDDVLRWMRTDGRLEEL